MEQQKIRFAPGDRVQRTKSNGKKAHVGAQGTVSAILKSGNLQVRADGQPLSDCVWKPENVERVQPPSRTLAIAEYGAETPAMRQGRELHEKLSEHALALQAAYDISYFEACLLVSFAAPKPEVCTHATAQMLTEWPNPGAGYARDCFELRKAQQDTEIRAHYTRNMREWPTCQYGGKVEIKLWASTDTNAPGPMRYTYGLVCACCSKKVATK